MKLDGEVGILGNGAGLVMSTLDVVALAGGRPANFCDLGGGGDAQGVVDALEVITADPQVRVDLLQHLRRDHALRRGRARDPRRRSTQIDDRRTRSSSGSTARTPRRAGALLAEAAPPNLHVEPTMLDARAGARWSWRAMTRRLVASAREALPRERRAPRGAATSTCSSSGRAGRERRRSTSRPAAATSRGGCARPGCEVVTSTRRRACSPTSICRAEDLPFADGELRRRRLPRRRAPLRGRRRGACAEMARVARRPRARRRQPVHGRARSRRPSGCATRATSATTPRPSGARSSTRAGLEVEEVELFEQAARARALARRAPAARARTPSACASCSPTAIDGRLRRGSTASCCKASEALDGDHRRPRHAARRPGPDRARGLASTALRNRAYGTNVVAGVTPGQGRPGRRGDPGLRHRRRRGRPRPARTRRWSSSRPASPPTRSTRRSTPGIGTVICITEGLPAHDMLRVYNYIRPQGVTMIGPNCPGVLSPGKANVGIIPAEIFREGAIGLVSPLGHADLPDRPRADPARARQLDDRRHRRRPGRRLVVHRRPRAASRPTPRPSSS